jgi:hypothetical protein
MRLNLCVILASVAALCAGETAAKERKTQAVDPKLGGIAVSIKVKGPTVFSTSPHATAAFFVKEGESTDVFRSAAYQQSDFAKGDQIYLLNVEPGKYVLIGAFTPRVAGAPNAPQLPSANTYFDEGMIRTTEVTVEAGSIAFMGEITVKTSVGMKGADEAQNFYGDLIGRGMSADVGVGVTVASHARPSYSLGISPGHVTRAGALKSMERDAETERKFWKRAINVLDGEPDWQQLAQARLDALH